MPVEERLPALDQSVNDGTVTSRRHTPLVRRLAKELRVDLDKVAGTGAEGRVRKQAVLAAAGDSSHRSPSAVGQPAVSTSLEGHTDNVSPMREVIAGSVVDSQRTSGQLTQVLEVDVTNVSRLLDSVNAGFAVRTGVELTYFSFFAKATIDALKSHPSMNATVDSDKGEVTHSAAGYLSIAVDTPRGPLSPVIKDAGDLSLAGLARRIADLAGRGRNNRITPDQLAGGTFTMTNTPGVGVLFDTPMLKPPQRAILGTGTVVKRPVVVDDPDHGVIIAVRQMVYLVLTYDHRLAGAADAARFLTDIKQRLEAGRFEV